MTKGPFTNSQISKEAKVDRNQITRIIKKLKLFKHIKGNRDYNPNNVLDDINRRRVWYELTSKFYYDLFVLSIRFQNKKAKKDFFTDKEYQVIERWIPYIKEKVAYIQDSIIDVRQIPQLSIALECKMVLKLKLKDRLKQVESEPMQAIEQIYGEELGLTKSLLELSDSSLRKFALLDPNLFELSLKLAPMVMMFNLSS